MNRKFRKLLTLLLSAAAMPLMTSCIREALPDINVDVKSVNPTLGIGADGIVKSTVQEDGVTLYANMAKATPENLDLTVTVSNGATWSFVDVEFDSIKVEYPEGSGNYIFVPGQCPVFTNVKGEIAKPKDFTKTRYIKVVSAAEGISEDDHKTPELIKSQQICRECLFSGKTDCNHPSLLGWEKDGVMSRTYTEGAHLYKIWTVNVLPAGLPTKLSFDNWESRGSFQHPFEIVEGAQSNVWSSTNASIALMAVNPLIVYGAQPTTDAVSGKALLLTSNDIRFAGTPQKPYIAGCCFIGEFDGSDTGALTCTHVGLPFDKIPESLSFYYKYLPMDIKEPGGEFISMGEYAGKKDRGFIRAVLYRADGDTKWVNGESIRLFPNIPNDLSEHAKVAKDNIVAYAEFSPEGVHTQYEQVTIPFTYVNGGVISQEDASNWKYNLAIYFASSYEGFRFICGADMSNQMVQLNTLNDQMKKGQISQADFYTQYLTLMASQRGTQLYIDEMEINCK